jgi:hypothetical protein
MKIKRTKNIFVSIMFLMLSSILLWTCQQEEPIENNVDTEVRFKVERHQVIFEELKSNHSKAYEIITSLNREENVNFLSKTEDIYSDEYDLYYNLNRIYHIEGENHEQFSFLVRSSDRQENQFENYLLIQYADEFFRHFVVTYEYTSTDKDEYDFLSIRELEGDQLFSRNIANCPNVPQLEPVTIETCTYSNCFGEGAGDHTWANRSACNCENMSTCSPPSENCDYTTVWVMTCGGGGSDGGNTDDGSNDSSDGTNGGGGNSGNDNTNDDDDIPVIPVEETAMDRILECMNTMSITGPNVSMPQSLVDSLSMNLRCANPLDTFIQAQGCSFENKSFAIDAARACLQGGEIEYDEKIINNLTGRDKCIYDKLKALNLFKNTVSKFTIGPYNLTFSYAGICNGGAGEEACTDAADLENGNITIKILGSATSSNELDFAATILHEGIHAEMYKYVKQFNNGVDPNERENLFHYYEYYKAENSNDFATSIAQHQYMQDVFVIPMAKAIRQLDNYRFPLEDYLGFGWEGLKKDYDYDHYIDGNGQVQTMTPAQYNELINRKNEIVGSSNFASDCN